MSTKSKSRGRGLVLAVLTLIVGMPELAKAQQSGLFPLAPIKRQRPPCDQEDPVYKVYKEKYFGYHPPCWRPFPTGWGCPSPEKPDVEKAFRERKLSTDLNAPARDTEDMQPAGQPGAQPGLPALPGGRSPFEQPAPGGGNPATPRQAPRSTSPFDLMEKPAATPEPAPGAPRGAGRTRPASPGIGDGSPELSAPDEAIPVSGGADEPGYTRRRDSAARKRRAAARTSGGRPGSRPRCRHTVWHRARPDERGRSTFASTFGASPRLSQRSVQQPWLELDAPLSKAQ